MLLNAVSKGFSNAYSQIAVSVMGRDFPCIHVFNTQEPSR